MQKIEILVGIPASGKSTYAKSLVSREPELWVRVNNDDIRLMLHGGKWSPENEKQVTATRKHLIADALSRGRNVVVDNLNTNPKHYDEVCEIAQQSGRDVQVYEKSFYIDLKDALERNSKREYSVPEEVVRRKWDETGRVAHKHYKPKHTTFVKRQNILQEQDPSLPKAIICDIDGTLALVNGRSPYDTAKSANDIPNASVIETVKLFATAGYKIIFCTGREEKFREISMLFINCHVGLSPEQFILLMREDEDKQNDAKAKQEMYDREIKPHYNVLFVLDDRNRVVNMWRENGLSCYQVNPGDF